MTRKFSRLRGKMSPAARTKSHELAAALLAELPLRQPPRPGNEGVRPQVAAKAAKHPSAP